MADARGVRRRVPVAAPARRGVKLRQLGRPWPCGVSTIAISARTPSSPTTRSTQPSSTGPLNRFEFDSLGPVPQAERRPGPAGGTTTGSPRRNDDRAERNGFYDPVRVQWAVDDRRRTRPGVLWDGPVQVAGCRLSARRGGPAAGISRASRSGSAGVPALRSSTPPANGTVDKRRSAANARPSARRVGYTSGITSGVKTTEVWPNAPLALVAVEARFPAASAGPLRPPVQRAIRDLLGSGWVLESGKQQTVELAVASSGLQAQNVKLEDLTRITMRDRTTAVTVRTESLTIEATRYGGYANFRELVGAAFTAVERILEPDGIARLGIRYIDEIRVPQSEISNPWDGWIDNS
ncbi:MAG: TIGR04255 family protein, partial [Actinobacteria bacterium]|nr:TIGR04255 family protein [Actinomycetota bacterium]